MSEKMGSYALRRKVEHGVAWRREEEDGVPL